MRGPTIVYDAKGNWDGDQRNLMADGLVGNVAATFVNPFLTPFALRAPT
ncbi:MAG: hypothetical protein WD024_08090 [Bacillota bacterium]